MPIVFGETANSAAEIVTVLKKHGDRVRGVYRSRYCYDRSGGTPYAPPSPRHPYDRLPHAQCPRATHRPGPRAGHR